MNYMSRAQQVNEDTDGTCHRAPFLLVILFFLPSFRIGILLQKGAKQLYNHVKFQRPQKRMCVCDDGDVSVYRSYAGNKKNQLKTPMFLRFPPPSKHKP